MAVEPNGAGTWRPWCGRGTVTQNGWNPLTYLTEYLTAYARNGNQPLSEEALAAFLPKTEIGGHQINPQRLLR
ncbi:MAG: hypothetical protein M1596_01285 [Firmicutes bacterium]|nr:hypothetical protein [Bacillota bacterium]